MILIGSDSDDRSDVDEYLFVETQIYWCLWQCFKCWISGKCRMS